MTKIKELFPSVLALLDEVKETKEEKKPSSVILFEEQCAIETLRDLLLKKISAQGEEEATSENLQELREFLANRWNVIGETDLCYLHATQHKLTQACTTLALALSPIFKQSYFQLLMPTIHSEAIDLGTAEPIGEALTKDASVQLHQFVLSDPDDSKPPKHYCINIKGCLDSAIEDGVLKHTTHFERKVLNPSEIKRVTEHSPSAAAYHRAIQKYIEFQTKGISFGAALKRLSVSLNKGSVSGSGSEYKAGTEAIEGIKQFYNFIQTLDETEKNSLFALTSTHLTVAPNFKIIWLRLLSRAELELRNTSTGLLSEPELSAMLTELAANSTTQVPCVQLIGSNIEHLLSLHATLLFNTYPKSKALSSDIFGELTTEVKTTGEQLEKTLNSLRYSVGSTYPNGETRITMQVGRYCFSPRDENTLLHYAIESDDIALTSHLIRALPFLINKANANGITPLYLLAKQNQQTVLTQLTNSDIDFFPVFVTAARLQDKSILVNVLRAFDDRYYEVLKQAFTFATVHQDLQLLRMLFQLESPYTILPKKVLPYLAAREGFSDILKELVAQGCSTHSSVIRAINENASDTLAFLLEHGANPREAFIEFLDTGKTAAIELLLSQKVDPNMLLVESNLTTPLHIASQLNNLAMVELLLRFGANPNVVDRWGNSPLDYAVKASIIEVLKKHGAHPIDLILMRSRVTTAKDCEDLAFALISTVQLKGKLNTGLVVLPYPLKYTWIVRKLRRMLEAENISATNLEGKEEKKLDSSYGKSTPLTRRIVNTIQLLMDPKKQLELIEKNQKIFPEIKFQIPLFDNAEEKTPKTSKVLDWSFGRCASVLLPDEMVVCFNKGKIYVLDPFNGILIRQFPFLAKCYNPILTVLSDHHIAIRWTDGESSQKVIYTFNLNTGVYQPIISTKMLINGLFSLPDGNLAIGFEDDRYNSIHIVDGKTGKLIREIGKDMGSSINPLLADGNIVRITYSGSCNATMDIFSPLTGTLKGTHPILEFARRGICLENGYLVLAGLFLEGRFRDSMIQICLYSSSGKFLKEIRHPESEMLFHTTMTLLPLKHNFFAFNYRASVAKPYKGWDSDDTSDDETEEKNLCCIYIYNVKGELVYKNRREDVMLGEISPAALKLFCEQEFPPCRARFSPASIKVAPAPVELKTVAKFGGSPLHSSTGSSTSTSLSSSSSSSTYRWPKP